MRTEPKQMDLERLGTKGEDRQKRKHHANDKVDLGTEYFKEAQLIWEELTGSAT